MVVDQPSKSATLDGSVVIVNRGDEPGALPVQVNADRAVALFEPRAAPTTKPAIAQNSEASGETNVQLKWLTLWGNMVATRDGATLNADRADYNPATGWMVAVGNGRNPAVFTDATGTSTVWADQIHWNTQNWLMRFVNVRGRTGNDANRTPPAPVPAAPARTNRK